MGFHNNVLLDIEPIHGYRMKNDKLCLLIGVITGNETAENRAGSLKKHSQLKTVFYETPCSTVVDLTAFHNKFC